MLRLVYSSHTEQLLDTLVADVSAYREARGALEPVHLVLPNRNVETYVRFGLAQATGIAANLEVHLLRRFVSDLVSEGPDKVRLVGAGELRALVLGLLLDEERLARPEFGPVRAYLHAAGDSADALDLRRFQLADQLSRLFEEYTFSREGLLREWPKRALLQKTPLAEAERWQRALWLELWREDGPKVGELAARLRVEPPTVTRMLQRLEGCGLVERRRDPGDARSFRVYLTRKGRDLEGPVAERWGTVEARAFEGMSEEEMLLLRGLLARIRKNLGAV